MGASAESFLQLMIMSSVEVLLAPYSLLAKCVAVYKNFDCFRHHQAVSLADPSRGPRQSDNVIDLIRVFDDWLLFSLQLSA